MPKNFWFDNKKAPFIHPSSRLDFSLKYLTLLLTIFIAPNLAGGLTAVKSHQFFLPMRNFYQLKILTLDKPSP